MRNVTRPVLGPLLVAATVAIAITMAGALALPSLLAGKQRNLGVPARAPQAQALLEIERCPIEVIPGGLSMRYRLISSDTGYDCPYFRAQA
jgi:hypothetical protein